MYVAYWRRRNLVEINPWRTCARIGCGVRFWKPKRQQYFCSRKCCKAATWRRYYKAKKKAETPRAERQCQKPDCGKMFTPASGHQTKYCSKRCNRRMAERAYYWRKKGRTDELLRQGGGLAAPDGTAVR